MFTSYIIYNNVYIIYNTAVFTMSYGLFCFSSCLLGSWLGVHKKLGEDTAKTADPSWLKEYYVLSMLSNWNNMMSMMSHSTIKLRGAG